MRYYETDLSLGAVMTLWLKKPFCTEKDKPWTNLEANSVPMSTLHPLGSSMALVDAIKGYGDKYGDCD